jgi:hypothetical protein
MLLTTQARPLRAILPMMHPSPPPDTLAHLQNQNTMWKRVPPKPSLKISKLKTGALKVFLSATPCASPPPWPSIFSDNSFCVHPPVNWDDRHLLAQAMASDFSVVGCIKSRKPFGFLKPCSFGCSDH